MLQGQVHIRQGLGLDALGGVNQKQGPLAGIDGPGHFVGKVNMAGGIHQVEFIGIAVQGGIGDGYRLALDGDPPFPFYVHVIQYLILKIPVFHQMAFLDEPVRQGGLSVVNVGDNAKIADIRWIRHNLGILLTKSGIFSSKGQKHQAV
jgi:hypothetical protein